MHRRISNVSASLLMITAGIIDLLSIIPFASIPIAIIGWIIFGLWFIKLGVGFKSPKRLAAPAISLLVEIIPVISIVPSFLLAIGMSIAIITYEDYQAFLKKKSQENSQRNTPLSRYYSQSQIVSTPETEEFADLNQAEDEPMQEVLPSQYGVRQQNNPRNVYQISDVKSKEQKNNRVNNLAA